jgi:hypothetical protein
MHVVMVADVEGYPDFDASGHAFLLRSCHRLHRPQQKSRFAIRSP